MSNKEIVSHIEELFKKWWYIHMLDSTSMRGGVEYDELLEYCENHIEEFKQFAQESLEAPGEWSYSIAELCDKLLTNEKPLDEQTNFVERFVKVCKKAKNISFGCREKLLFENCNIWLNYFKGTNDVDYYDDYVKYKEYLDKHYISWNPHKEDDPNPTYEEFVNNKEKYKI